MRKPLSEAAQRTVAKAGEIDRESAELKAAKRAYDSFTTSRATTDLNYPEWANLGTLYEVYSTSHDAEGNSDATIRLRFLPDTPSHRDENTLLLLLYGYQQIYQQMEVSAAKLQSGLYGSGCYKNTPIMFRVALFNEPVDVDSVAQSSYLSSALPYRLISPKFGLRQGGFYKLTDYGREKAKALFDDLIRRA